MQKNLSLKLLPSEASENKSITDHIAGLLAVNQSAITGFYINKKSYDARSKQVMVNLSVTAFFSKSSILFLAVSKYLSFNSKKSFLLSMLTRN